MEPAGVKEPPAFFFPSALSGLLKQWANIPSPCCQPDILGISPSPWWRTPPCCSCFGFPGPARAPGHTSTRLQSSAAVGRSPPATRVPIEGWSTGEQKQGRFSTPREPRPLPTQRAEAGTPQRLPLRRGLAWKSWVRAQSPLCASEQAAALFPCGLRSRSRSSRASPVGCAGCYSAVGAAPPEGTAGTAGATQDESIVA